MVQKAKLKADNNILTMLIRQVGPALRDLNTSLDKIKLMIHPDNVITAEVVEKLGGESQNIFLINDLIIEKKFDKALFEISKYVK